LISTDIFLAENLVFVNTAGDRHGNGVDRSIFSCTPPVEVNIDYGSARETFDDHFQVKHNGNENLVLEVKFAPENLADLALYDITGRIILRVPTTEKFSSYKLNTANLPAGIYLIASQLKNGKRLASKVFLP
jgi:hypothetical protein